MTRTFPRACLKSLRRSVCRRVLFSSLALRADQGFPAAQIEFFEKSVRPVLVENCRYLSGKRQKKLGLRLDSREAVLRGSDFNKVVVAGGCGEQPVDQGGAACRGTGANAFEEAAAGFESDRSPRAVDQDGTAVAKCAAGPKVAAALGVSAGEETGGAGDHKPQVAAEWSETISAGGDRRWRAGVGPVEIKIRLMLLSPQSWSAAGSNFALLADAVTQFAGDCISILPDCRPPLRRCRPL